MIIYEDKTKKIETYMPNAYGGAFNALNEYYPCYYEDWWREVAERLMEENQNLVMMEGCDGKGLYIQGNEYEPVFTWGQETHNGEEWADLQTFVIYVVSGQIDYPEENLENIEGVIVTYF